MKAKLFILIFSLTLLFTVNEISAQPGPPADHGSTNDESPAGGGAPVAGGIGFLIALGAAYGVRKWQLKAKDNEE